MRWPWVLLCALPGAGVVPVRAQDAGALLRDQERRQEQQRLQSRPSRPEQSTAETPAAEESGQTLEIRDVRFTGKIELLSVAERTRWIDEARGKMLGVMGLQSLTDRITARLQQQGRLLARAILPPQDITEGVVTIEIVEGTLEAVEFERGKQVRVDESLLEGIIARRHSADSATRADLESALLRLNDLPGVSVRAKLTPGSSPNTTNLVVGVEQAPIFSGTFWGDNHGNVSTGREQANLLVTLTDLTGRGDDSQFFASAAQGQTFAQAMVSTTLGASGLTAHARYSWLDYQNRDDIGRAAELDGTAHHAALSLDYSLVRARDWSARLSGGVGWKALTDESLAGRLNDKRAWSSSLAVSLDSRDGWLGGGRTSSSVSWTHGDIDLSRIPAALAADAATLRTNGRYHRVNASIARIQYVSPRVSLFARMYAQWANGNLDSSEDFALGGPYGVRAYPVGEGRADMGVLGAIELRYDTAVPLEWGDVQLATFFDAGHVWVNRDSTGVPALNACACNEFGLESAGLALRWTRESLSLSASHAYAVGSNPGRSRITGANADGKTDRQQLWLQGAIRF
jgi:hemolysin activation/secretion protein